MIDIASKKLRASVAQKGATLSGLWLEGVPHSLVLGAPEETAYASRELQYVGAIVGPVANRVAGGKVSINDRVWKMPANEGQNTLHSGPEGLHAQHWTITKRATDRVGLTSKLPHGANGLPGNRSFEVTYRFVSADVLELCMSATSDADTVVNLAHHPYWNLDGASTIFGHKLKVAASFYLPVGQDMLPTGVREDVKDTPYDFRSARPINTTRTLDANLCLDQRHHDTPRPIAALTGTSGVKLEIETTEPGLQIYNGAHLQPTPSVLHSGQALCPFAGIALEPQRWPDAPRHENFPSILLRANERYRQITRYLIS